MCTPRFDRNSLGQNAGVMQIPTPIQKQVYTELKYPHTVVCYFCSVVRCFANQKQSVNKQLSKKGKVCTGPSTCTPYCQSLSQQFLKHEGTRSTSTPLPTTPGGHANSSQGYPQPIKFACTHLYTWLKESL